jgi:hypothetical protein
MRNHNEATRAAKTNDDETQRGEGEAGRGGARTLPISQPNNGGLFGRDKGALQGKRSAPMVSSRDPHMLDDRNWITKGYLAVSGSIREVIDSMSKQRADEKLLLLNIGIHREESIQRGEQVEVSKSCSSMHRSAANIMFGRVKRAWAGAQDTRTDLSTTMEGRPTMKTKTNDRSSNTRRAVFTNDLKVGNPSTDSGAANSREDAVMRVPSGSKEAIKELIRKSKMRTNKKVGSGLEVLLLKRLDAIRRVFKGNLFGMNILQNKGGRRADLTRGNKIGQATNGGVQREGNRPRRELRDRGGVAAVSLNTKRPPSTEHGGFV